MIFYFKNQKDYLLKEKFNMIHLHQDAPIPNIGMDKYSVIENIEINK